MQKHVKNFVFGGFSSRFWVYRKQIIGSKKNELMDLPFYSWQCITIQLPNRDVDLVIPNDQDMNKLLKLLIHSMSTVDGCKGSATKLIEILNKEASDDYKRVKQSK